MNITIDNLEKEVQELFNSLESRDFEFTKEELEITKILLDMYPDNDFSADIESKSNT